MLSAAPVAVDDAYVTNANTVLSITDPVAVAPASTFSGLVEKQSISLGYNVSQIEYSAAYDLAFVRVGTSSIHVIDGHTGADLGVQNATNQFTDFSVSPDGRYLYVADYGGTNSGYGTPSGTSYVDRYDAATQTWTSKSVSGIAYQIEAVDDDRFLLKSIDQWTAITLNSFGPPAATSAAQLASINGDFGGDFEYDPATGRIYLGNSDVTSHEIHVYQVAGDTLAVSESTGPYGSAQNGGGSSVLSTDGRYFFYGSLQVDAVPVGTDIRKLPETMPLEASERASLGSGRLPMSSRKHGLKARFDSVCFHGLRRVGHDERRSLGLRSCHAVAPPLRDSRPRDRPVGQRHRHGRRRQHAHSHAGRRARAWHVDPATLGWIHLRSQRRLLGRRYFFVHGQRRQRDLEYGNCLDHRQSARDDHFGAGCRGRLVRDECKHGFAHHWIP